MYQLNSAFENEAVRKEEMERAYFNPCLPHALLSAFATILQLEIMTEGITEYPQVKKSVNHYL